MINYRTIQAGEKIKNLDLCYIGVDNKLYQIKNKFQLNYPLAIPIINTSYDDYVLNDNSDKIVLPEGTYVLCMEVTLIPKIKLC